MSNLIKVKQLLSGSNGQILTTTGGSSVWQDQVDTFVSGMTFNVGTYDLTIDRNNFIDALEKNLTHYEKEELYEECAKIIDAIKFLKNKVNG